MKVKTLVDGGDTVRLKDIVIFDDPKSLKGILSKVSWDILKLLSKNESYSMEIARRLNIHEQKVYYHMRKLLRSGIIRVARTEKRKGALTKIYKVSYPAMGVELPFGEVETKSTFLTKIDFKVREFFFPFIKDGKFNGKIVVGSPDPHGPFKARARDGHYAIHFTFFMGNFIGLPEHFTVKLDVDVKAEKEENNNLILIGGPGTNLLTQEVNEHLPIKFDVYPSEHGYIFGGLCSQESGNVYMADNVGVVARIPNPWAEDKTIIVLAGNKSVGTKACVLAITKFWKDVLKEFEGQEKFATVIQGFDFDGDGKVDSVEVLE